MGNYTFAQGLTASAFSILIVFGILILLSFIVSLLKYVGKEEAPVKQKKQSPKSPEPVVETGTVQDSQLIAAIVASCIVSDSKN